MKYLVCFCICVSVAFGLHAQNTFPSSGNVGVGTTTPGANIEIHNSTNSTTTPLISIRSDFHTPGNYGMIRFGDYTQTTDYQKGALIYESISGSSRGKFHIALENSESSASVSLSDSRLTILSNGNVGINTTAPLAKLDIRGTLLTGGGSGNLDPGGTPDLSFLQNSGLMLIGWNRSGGRGESNFINNRGGGSVGGFSFIDLSNAGITKTLMNINGDGNVGIGTEDPQAKLGVNGLIRSREVKVEVINWPDYVFKSSYKLPSISDVKAYIDKFKHLPEMPSEADVAKGGVNLGEMNMLLVKKIEELTLYLVDLKQENNSIKKRLSKIEQTSKRKCE